MRTPTFFLLSCLFAAVATPASAEDMKPWSYAAERAIRSTEDTTIEKHQRRLWKWSMVALVACTAFDAATSLNNPEGNPVLRSSNGQFGYRGILLKSALASGTIAFEFHFSKKTRMYKPLAIFNFVQAGVFGGAAVYNSTFLGR
jgi:hypothetical protein